MGDQVTLKVMFIGSNSEKNLNACDPFSISCSEKRNCCVGHCIDQFEDWSKCEQQIVKNFVGS